MRIRITQDALPASPIPVQSCFFCGMPVVSETARALKDLDSGRHLGWGCSSCLCCTPDQLQQMLSAKIARLRSSADRHYCQAERLCVQADELERIMRVLSRPRIRRDIEGAMVQQ